MTTLIVKFNRLPKQLRWLTFFLTLLILTSVWWDWGFEPLQKKIAVLDGDRQVAQQIARDLKGDYAVYERFLHVPSAMADQQISLLDRQLANLKKNVLLKKEALSSISNFQPVLQAISRAPTGIVIQKLQVVKEEKENQSMIMLQFRGNFFSTVQYLKYIESLPWFLIYDNLSYEVTQYPSAEISVELIPV